MRSVTLRREPFHDGACAVHRDVRPPRRLKRGEVHGLAGLPLLSATPPRWAEIAAADLPTLLADHAVCEQQAALTGLNLVAHYPDDAELVERMTALAAEEVLHLRRVTGLLHRRGLRPMRRRRNPYVHALRRRIRADSERDCKMDRLLVGALIEARSCERFTLLHRAVASRDPEVARLFHDLGPAERRHWVMFHRLAGREVESASFESVWRGWLEYEAEVHARGGSSPFVHG